MKKQKKALSILICIMILFASTSNLIYALNENVLPGYNQVTTIGGTNSLNNDGEEDGVVVSKTISETNINGQKNHENYFDITLTVNTTTKIEEIITQPDLAIVVVMDISNTMRESKVSSGETRYQAAMKAGESFIKKFAEYSTGSTAKRQLGYVSFNTNVHKTFELQDCKNATTATNLVSTMKTSTGNIINASGYAGSKTKYTNIEGGLKMAWDMLETTQVENKYIILISDGFPTTYLNTNTKNNPYDGFEPYSTGVTKSSFGVFANSILKKPCSAGSDYSNTGAIKAREMATNIKNDQIDIMVVGTGISTGKTINDYLTTHAGKEFSTVDTTTTDYEIGTTRESFKNWLKTSIGSNKYYDSDDSSLETEYLKIFSDIQSELQTETQATWVAEDPMGTDGDVKNIQFLGFYGDNNNIKISLDKESENESDTATFSNNKISWDLKKSTYKTEVKNKTTHYIYEVRYRIRLENELNNFDINDIYETNGKTTLTYIIRDNQGYLSENKYIDFPIPKVVGYLGNLTFTKKSSFDDTNLSGVKFKLTHNENCKCHQEAKHSSIDNVNIIDVYATSNEQGTISFTNIPSGHTYKLIETETQTDYILSDKVYDITVSYGETSGIPETNIITNDIKKSNLEIQKLVEGNINNPGTFKFNLEIYFKDNKLTGNYNYKINNGETKTINIGTDIIELGNNDSMIIYDLPVGATYKVTETTTEGYEVQYELNSSDRQNGNIVSCTKDKECRLEEGNVNKVKFINIGGYLLPETGSSGMLILLIIGSLLLIGPVIYIGYEFYKTKKNIA